MAAPATPDTAGLLRRCLIALALVGAVGTAVDLAMLRHWESAVQLIPWAALAGVGAAAGLLAIRPSRTTVRVAQTLAGVVLASAAYGVYSHVHANYEAGPLDFRYAKRWETMSEAAR